MRALRRLREARRLWAPAMGAVLVVAGALVVADGGGGDGARPAAVLGVLAVAAAV